MILIKAVSQYAKAERLVSELNDEAMDWADKMEQAGFVVAMVQLPSHIKTPEQFAAILLDEWAEQYLPQNNSLN